MYKLIFLISLVIRQFCLPNPFECFGDKALLYNWIAGLVLAPVTYYLVGLFYEKGSMPALGSLLYLLFYAGLTGVLYMLGLVSFAWWAILSMIVGIILLVVLIKRNSEQLPKE